MEGAMLILKASEIEGWYCPIIVTSWFRDCPKSIVGKAKSEIRNTQLKGLFDKTLTKYLVFNLLISGFKFISVLFNRPDRYLPGFIGI